MQHVYCNLCGADDTSLVAVQNGYRAVVCLECGLVYMTPRPGRDDLLRLYEEYHGRGGKDERAWAVLMEKNFLEVSRMLNERFPGGGTLLDIGCGYGHFIEKMQSGGWTVTGIEPSGNASECARKKGLKVARATLEEAAFPDNSFDAVTAFYVLEHLFDPLAALNKIRAMLKPGGMLVARVPHTTPVVRLLGLLGVKNNLYDMPYHLYDFSPRAMRQLMEKAGLSSVEVTPGRPTVPYVRFERMVSTLSGTLARCLYWAGGERLLMPGISKTYIGLRPSQKGDPGHA